MLSLMAGTYAQAVAADSAYDTSKYYTINLSMPSLTEKRGEYNKCLPDTTRFSEILSHVICLLYFIFISCTSTRGSGEAKTV